MSIKATFPAGVTAMTVNGLHQWDYGRTLEIEAPELPTLVEIHFACAGMQEAEVRSCALIDGKMTAAIPDICLEQTSPVIAWVYEIGETNGRTTRMVTLPIIQRAKPQGSVTITPAVADKYTELLAAVNDLIEDIQSGELALSVEHVAQADHADEADHALEADHAAEADRAAAAGQADEALTLSDTLAVEKGGTGVTSLEELAEKLGVESGGGSVDYAARAGYADSAGSASYANSTSAFAGHTYAQLFTEDFNGSPIAKGALGLAGLSNSNVVYVDAEQVLTNTSNINDTMSALAQLMADVTALEKRVDALE